MDSLFGDIGWASLMLIPGMLISYTVHELGHVIAAYLLGDHTQVEHRKITINPVEHISWLGAFAFMLFGIGWPKTMQVTPKHFKRRHLDLLLVALAGPMASFSLTVIALVATSILATIVILMSGASSEQVIRLFVPADVSGFPTTWNAQALAMISTTYIVTTSMVLTFMSLLPLPGQDGFAAMASLIALLRERNAANARGQNELTDFATPRASGERRANKAADIHFSIGTEYHAEEKYDDAIIRYRQTLANDNQFGPAYINMGLAYLALGDRRRAIQAFRGATRYADDQRSRSEAWHQLQLLSQVTPVDQELAQKEMAQLGANPWTDTLPRPDWWAFGISIALVLMAIGVIYLVLIAQLLAFLQG